MAKLQRRVVMDKLSSSGGGRGSGGHQFSLRKNRFKFKYGSF